MLNAGIKTSHFRKIVYGIEQGYIMIYEHILIVVTAHTNNIIFGIVQNSAAKKRICLDQHFPIEQGHGVRKKPFNGSTTWLTLHF